MMHGLASGLTLFTGHPVAILLLLVGMLAGTLIGVIPGLGGAVLLTMMLPFLYGMPVVPAVALMLAAHASIYFSGSITSILFNTPGVPESAATTIDGYAMTQQGKAARAMGISAAATTMGGWVGFIVLVLVIPIMYSLVTLFHPPEYLMLAILAVVLISQLRSASLTKGLLSGSFGLMLSMVGYDPVTGIQRFSFNVLSLYNGINISVVALGIFAFSEMYFLFGVNRAMAHGVSVNLSRQPGARVWDGVRDVFGHLGLVGRSSVIGVLVGLVPGVGGVAGNFISYGQAVRTSKHPENFGKGIPEGIIAPESSSLSKEAGSLIPTVALGIPGSVGMAILMSAFTILGLVPGPTMVTNHLNLVYFMAWVLAITSLLASFIGLVLAPFLAKLTTVQGPILVPFIFVLGFLGAYVGTSDLVQTAAVAFLGVVALVMKRLGYSLPGAIIGFVLGRIAENNLYLTERIFGWRFVERPLTDLLMLIILAVIVMPALSKRKKERLAAEGGREKYGS